MKQRKSSEDQTAVHKIVVLIVGFVGFISAALLMRQSNWGSTELASSPSDLSWRSWKKALLKTKDAFSNKNIAMFASGIAYGGTLAFFPFVVASVAIASIVISQDQINEITSSISSFLPSDMAGLLNAQLASAVDDQSTNALVASVAIAVALFGVSGAMSSLVGSLNVVYQVEETRGIIKARLVSIGLTGLLILGLLITLPLIALGGDMLATIGLPALFVTLFSVFRWLLLAGLMTLGLAVIYRYAPDRPNVRWQWVSWGAIIATLLWLLVTAIFFIYVQNFANFSESYSLFAGIIVLMMWLNFTGLVILVGAEVNHQLEKRTIYPAD